MIFDLIRQTIVWLDADLFNGFITMTSSMDYNQYSSIMHQFQFLKELGSGSFGRVVKVRKNLSKTEVYAMKQIKMLQLSSREKDNALNEVRLLASIHSPNIISYKSAFFEEFGNTLCILMEYADGGDLAGLIKKKIDKNQRFSQNFIWQIAFDILQGLKMLHSNKIVHRDVKPANIFIVNGVAKIGDLNVSKVMEGNFALTQTGTPYYTSPEIWNNQKYDERCDIWSLGCLLYELTMLRPPFLAKDFPGLSRKITIGYYQPVSSSYSKMCSQLIKQCLTLKHTQRPTASQLLDQPMFQNMLQNQDEGDIELLDTIRCPKVLKQLHHKLPEGKSVKKLVTLKNIEQPIENDCENLKKIRSQKCIGLKMAGGQAAKEEKENEKLNFMKIPMQSPNGYVKLPRINSQKNILF